jgi:hypothetical protein
MQLSEFNRIHNLFIRYKSEHPGRFAAHTLKGQSQLAGFPRCPGSFLLFNCGKLISFFSANNFIIQNLSNVPTFAKPFREAVLVRPQ